jgi:hypothetical protein
LDRVDDQIEKDPGTMRTAKAGLIASLAGLMLSACAAQTQYLGIPFAPGAAPPPIQSLAQRAAMGNKQAQYELGVAFETGEGVPADPKRARKLYRAAATQTGGTIFVYVPGPKGKAGYVMPINMGPVISGLPEAKARLKALKAVEKAKLP